MKFVNLTAHKICIISSRGEVESFDPSGQIVRLSQDDPAITYVDGYIVSKPGEYIGIEPDWLMNPEHETIYIVSNPVAAFVKRKDVWAPDTNPESCIRDEFGQVIGVKRFCCYAVSSR